MNTEEEIQQDDNFWKLLRKNWLPAYTWVLIANAAYILLFLIITLIFN
jgi:hypothetical protein